MAQLENTGGQGGAFVAQGDVSVSRSTDGGVNWSEPITVFKGQGAGHRPRQPGRLLRQGMADGRQQPGSPFYGRAYVTTSRFLNGQQGAYAESPIWLSYSDDGGLTWSTPTEISGSHPSCTFQTTGSGTDCDEDQFSIPEVAPNGDLYVHFLNGQNEAAWEVDFDLDNQIMVTKSTDGGQTLRRTRPDRATRGRAQRHAVFGDRPPDRVGPSDPLDLGRQHLGQPAQPRRRHRGLRRPGHGQPERHRRAASTRSPATAPAYDPCNAGPSSNTNVY